MTIDLRLTARPRVIVGMGIHRPPSVVFDAFVNPTTTKRFWIVDSTGPLEPDATVIWDLTANGAKATVAVRDFEPGERLVIGWGDDDAMSTVEFRFAHWRDSGCYVEITETEFGGDGDALAAHAADSTGGFTMVVCSLKALLEHDIELGVVTDRNPD